MSRWNYEIAEVSRRGHRTTNQDRCIIRRDRDSLLLVVADGMGGHPRGETAAQIVVDTCAALFDVAPKPIFDPPLFLRLLAGRSHTLVSRYGEGQRPPIDPRTTAVAALIQDGTVYWAHVGDSRFYLLRGGTIAAQTVDHSFVQQMEQDGLLNDRAAATHPMRNLVTRCIGGNGEPPEATLGGPRKLLGGDIVLLCSDGLWGPHEASDLTRAFSAAAVPLQATLERLAENAEQRSAPYSDNITALALRAERSNEDT